MKTLVEIDDALLDAARAQLGTTTKKDTVNAALRFVAQRPKVVRELFDLTELGIGEDAGDPEIMGQARR